MNTSPVEAIFIQNRPPAHDLYTHDAIYLIATGLFVNCANCLNCLNCVNQEIRFAFRFAGVQSARLTRPIPVAPAPAANALALRGFWLAQALMAG